MFSNRYLVTDCQGGKVETEQVGKDVEAGFVLRKKMKRINLRKNLERDRRQ